MSSSKASMTSLNHSAPNNPRFLHITLQNCGQKPACFSSTRIESIIGRLEDDEIVFPLSQSVHAQAKTLIPPGGAYRCAYPASLTAALVVVSQQSKKRAYVWGRVEYVDAFGAKRFTSFHMFNHLSDVMLFAHCARGTRRTTPSRHNR